MLKHVNVQGKGFSTCTLESRVSDEKNGNPNSYAMYVASNKLLKMAGVKLRQFSLRSGVLP
jgi:hypothetical protein